MLYQSHDEYKRSIVDVVLKNKDFFIAIIEEDANFRAWQNANFSSYKEFPHVLNSLTTDEAMAFITPIEALKYGNTEQLYNSLLSNFDLCVKIHNWIKANANIVDSWCEWQKRRAPSLWLPVINDSYPLREYTVVETILNNKDFFIALIEKDANFQACQNANFSRYEKFPDVLNSLTPAETDAFIHAIQLLKGNLQNKLYDLLLPNWNLCSRIYNWITRNTHIINSWCTWQKQRTLSLWLPHLVTPVNNYSHPQTAYRQAEERQQHAPVDHYALHPQPVYRPEERQQHAAYRIQPEDRRQQYAPVDHYPLYPQPAYRPEERQQQPALVPRQIPELHQANRPSAPQPSGKYYVVIPDSRSLDCNNFQIGNYAVYRTAQAAEKSLHNSKVRLFSPKIIEIDLPSRYETNNKGEVLLPEKARQHRAIRVSLNNVHAWPLQKQPEKVHAAFFQPEANRASSSNPINQIKSDTIKFMQAYQEDLRSMKVRIPQGEAYLRDIRLQYWPEKIKDRFLVSDNILNNLKKSDLTDKQLFICLQHGLTAAQRIKSSSLSEFLTRAIQNPCFANISMQSTQTTRNALMQQTIRGKVAAEDLTQVPNYLRCSLTGNPIKGTPITLMSGSTYDFDNILNHLKARGYNSMMEQIFKEEIIANNALKVVLIRSPLQEETLKSMLVVNRPLENLITKFNSNKDFEESDFCCEIVCEPYINPVLSVSGHGYSQDTLERSLESKQADPFNRQVMTVLEIRPNKAMAEAMLANKELFPENNPSNVSLHDGPGHG